jgi:hypothetical protein
MVDPEMIYNWRRLDDRITTSGRPTEQQRADSPAKQPRRTPCAQSKAPVGTRAKLMRRR